MWQQLALSQAALRLANERSAEGAIASGCVRVRCECGRPECEQAIEMPTAAYEDVRGDGARFVVVRGHGIEGVDRLLERRGRFDVVEAYGGAAEIARDLDPRSSVS